MFPSHARSSRPGPSSREGSSSRARRLACVPLAVALGALPAAAQELGDARTAAPSAADLAADAAAVPEFAIVDYTTRVVGGARTDVGHWPSVVALLHPGELSVPYNRQFCGGTVIESGWVLTAAHCMYDLFGNPIEAGEVSVLDGQTDLSEPSNGREIGVVAVHRHPGYVDDLEGRTHDDIALLQLASPTSAPPTELFAGDPEDYPGLPAAVIGWGATEYVTIGRTPFPDSLQRGVVPLVPRATCNAPEAYAGDVVDGQFCAGYPEGGVDTCIGDSGGPLYIQVDGRVQQAGVTSFGRGCALPDYYGIYTSTARYLDWIRQFVQLPIEPVPPVAAVAGGTDDGVVTTPRSPSGGAAGDGKEDGPLESSGGGGAVGAPTALSLLMLLLSRALKPAPVTAGP